MSVVTSIVLSKEVLLFLDIDASKKKVSRSALIRSVIESYARIKITSDVMQNRRKRRYFQQHRMPFQENELESYGLSFADAQREIERIGNV